MSRKFTPKNKHMGSRVPEHIYEGIAFMAAKTGETMAVIIRIALSDYLDKRMPDWREKMTTKLVLGHVEEQIKSKE